MDEPSTPENVVASIVLLNGIRCKLLFASGASHSFVSQSLANTHGIDIVDTVHTRWVQVLEHEFYVKNIYCDCPVKMDTSVLVHHPGLLHAMY